MRSREEIKQDCMDRIKQGQDGPAVRQAAMVELLLDIRDLLTEQSKKQRMEKRKACETCHGLGYTTNLVSGGEGHTVSVKKSMCPTCSISSSSLRN